MGHDDRELLPLGSSTFDVVRRGYDRGQVDEHLDRLDADLRILAADRDAAVARAAELGKQVENQRAQIINVEREMARLATAPASMEGMSERMQRMLRLAQDEAAEIRSRAETETSEMMARAEADGAALRERYQRLIAELETRRTEQDTEHRRVIDRANADAAQVVAESTELARQAGAEAAARRRQVEEDFEIAMSARRADAMHALTEQETSSKTEAERRVAAASEEANRRLQDATETAARRVAEAQADVERLRLLRDQLSVQLQQVRSVLADALEPLSQQPFTEPAAGSSRAEPSAPTDRPGNDRPKNFTDARPSKAPANAGAADSDGGSVSPIRAGGADGSARAKVTAPRQAVATSRRHS